MGGGALIAIGGIPLPSVESGVAASVLALGLLVAFAIRLPLAAGMALTGAFAIFHGHAHATELPAMVSPWIYAGGFLAATGLLHVSGIAAARALDANRLRIAGACVALAGAAFLVGS
jgi:urease accessory protein